jgi:hypothetical protein
MHQVVHANMLLFEIEGHFILIIYWFSYTIFSSDNVRTVTFCCLADDTKLSILRNDKLFLRAVIIAPP